jgi:DNA-binding transcriptional MerR regulator
MRAITASRAEHLPIGEISRLSGVNIETIRYYERIKMLPAPQRTASGRRVYGTRELRMLAFVRRSRELGFSLNEIRALLRLGGARNGVMQRGQSHCYTSSRRHSSQAIRLKKAGAAPGKDGSPMLGQKSTKLSRFGHSRCSAGISFAFVIVVRAVSPFGRPNVGFGVNSVIAVMSLHDRPCTKSGSQAAISLCRRSANCTRSSRGQSWVQTGERLRRDAFSDRSGRDQNALPGSRAAPRS